ncbi:hypothetical protein ASE69_20895 [Sphingomonas sp. Leaf208]|uniref:DUF4214 domain-containing protein n=1 Tax=Sphingomonas sp. Leaf208 TaxID=1735679 RepID=UPI0006F859E9|nr:DUF4214 domain-containing protein [Sphingomonas sp. Leaf208]KQM50072.1 hypothetical protein ASE69_20895 [Sphingomonas sp. Leaf208]
MTQIISADTTWKAGQTIVLSDKIQVAPGATLTIEAGAVVQGNGQNIQVFGSVVAGGTIDRSVELNNVSITFSQNYKQVGHFEASHTLFSGGSFLPATGDGSYGSFDISDSTFNGTSGFYIWYPADDSVFQGNYFVNTQGLSIGISGPKLLIDGNLFTGQTTNYNTGNAAVGVWANYSNSIEVSNNTFLSLDRTALGLAYGYDSSSMYAHDNFFNTTETSTIDRMITDRSDDLNYSSFINHSPVLSASTNGMLNPVIGTAQSDMLTGGSRNDLLLGGSGNDVLNGAAGNDFIDGGSGLDHTNYANLFETYAASVVDSITMIHGGASEGTDRLASVEYIAFADGVLQFNADDVFGQVLRVYDTVLARAPDAAGLDYYVDQMEDRGLTLFNVANDLSGSMEFQAATGGLSNEQFVSYVFQHALSRSPDAGGSAYYTHALDNGMSRGAFVVELSESTEHRALTQAQVAQGFFNTNDTYQSVALLYDSFAGRLPDTGGLTYYAEKVKSGALTLSQVANDFAGSTEFKSAIADKSNGEIVDFIYQNTLDRAADAGGKAFYTNQLNSGATAAGVLLDVALSQEHYNLFASHIVYGIDVF